VAATVASPLPEAGVGNQVLDKLTALLVPGGRPDELDRAANEHADLARLFTERAGDLRARVAVLENGAGWRGEYADAFRDATTAWIAYADKLAGDHAGARDALTMQAELKRQQQRQAEVLWFTLALTLLSAGVVVAAPAAAAAEATAAWSAFGDAAAFTAGGEMAGGNSLLRLLSAAVGVAEEASASVAQSLAQVLRSLLAPVGRAMARAGITTEEGLKSMGTVGGIGWATRMVDKAVASLEERGGFEWDNVGPALLDAVDPANWTADDASNVLLGFAGGPFIALSPVPDLVGNIGVRLGLPGLVPTFDALLGRGSAAMTAKVVREAADGAAINGGFTVVGAFGLNDEPLDDRESWEGVAQATAMGAGFGATSGAYAARFPSGKSTGGLDQAKIVRTIISAPADWAIAAGTRSAALPAVTEPVPGSGEPPPDVTPQVPRLTGGKTVRVQPGESLSRIAQRDLGDANLWTAVQHANPKLVDPNRLDPEEEIVEPLLPAPEERRRRH